MAEVREFVVIVSPRNFVIDALKNNLHSADNVHSAVGSGSFTSWDQTDIILADVPETYGDLT